MCIGVYRVPVMNMYIHIICMRIYIYKPDSDTCFILIICHIFVICRHANLYMANWLGYVVTIQFIT